MFLKIFCIYFLNGLLLVIYMNDKKWGGKFYFVVIK